MARPTKLNDQTHAAIVEAVSIGATYVTAAGAAGVTYHTFINWMERGESAKSGKFFKFFHDVEKAKQEAFLKYTKTIANSAAKGDWRAAESFLKRRDPDNWGDRKEVKNETKGEVVIRYADSNNAAEDARGATTDKE